MYLRGCWQQTPRRFPEKEEKAEKTTMDNEQIKSFQEELKAKEEDPGPIDSVIGKKTRSALRAFQNANDLKVTGTLETRLQKSSQPKNANLCAMRSPHASIFRRWPSTPWEPNGTSKLPKSRQSS
jgi:peptidoglycan hydrolase-like protein with peptidoglycan-binding domain